MSVANLSIINDFDILISDISEGFQYEVMQPTFQRIVGSTHHIYGLMLSKVASNLINNRRVEAVEQLQHLREFYSVTHSRKEG